MVVWCFISAQLTSLTSQTSEMEVLARSGKLPLIRRHHRALIAARVYSILDSYFTSNMEEKSREFLFETLAN